MAVMGVLFHSAYHLAPSDFEKDSDKSEYGRREVGEQGKGSWIQFQNKVNIGPKSVQHSKQNIWGITIWWNFYYTLNQLVNIVA